MQRPNRNGKAKTRFLAIIALLSLVGGAGYFMFPASSQNMHADLITSVVQVGDFSAKVTEQGSIRSASNVDIRSQVVARNGAVKVIDLVPEGTMAKEGDWLITLDGSQFEKELEQKQLEINTSATTVIQAQAKFDISVAAKDEYLQGTFVESKKKLENAIFDAQRILTQAKETHAHSKKLQLKGYITGQKLVADEFAVAQAQNSLDLTMQQLEVLKNITKRKELIRLDSDIDSARISLENAKQAKAILERQLQDIKQQLDYCKIHMPPKVSGEVIYAKDTDPDSRRRQRLTLGATVRERQILLQIPDRSKMEVEVLINEQNITSVRVGMPATMTVDALKNVELSGEVTKVSTYADPGEWYSTSSVKKYAVIVRIHDPPAVLKPGMNATVAIQTIQQSDAIQVPLQSVYAVGNEQFVFRVSGQEFETIPVQVGGLNSNDVWIEGDLEEGDLVLMDPGSHLESLDLPEGVSDQSPEGEDEFDEGDYGDDEFELDGEDFEFEGGDGNDAEDYPDDFSGSEQSYFVPIADELVIVEQI